MRKALVVSTLLGAIASAVYWGVALSVIYSLVAGDYSPVATNVPSEDGRRFRSISLVVVAVLLYAAVAWFWRRAEFRLMKED